MKHVEFHLTDRCTEACTFCCEEDQMAEFGRHPISFREAAFVLKLKARQGFRGVTFTGGEPTLHPDFTRVLRHARELGYRTHLITNGNTLANPKLAGRVLPHLDEICVSIHGPNAAVMDPITRLKGSFALAERALRNIDAHPGRLYVATSCILSRGNVDSLPATLEYLTRFRKVRHFTVANTAPIGGGTRRYDDLVVPLARIGGIAPALAALAARHGIALRFFGTPVCALGEGYHDLADDFHWPALETRVIIQRGRDASGKVGLLEISTNAHVRERVQTEACRSCAFNDTCAGIFRKYHQVFGDGELRPEAARPATAPPRPGRPLPRAEYRVTAFWALPEAATP